MLFQVPHSEHIHIVKFVSRTLMFLILQTPPTNCMLLKLKEFIVGEDPNVKLDVDSAKDDFFVSLEHLIKSKMHGVWYTMTQYILDYQTRHNCKLINCDFVSLQMGRVFRNLLSQKDVNFLGKNVINKNNEYVRL